MYVPAQSFDEEQDVEIVCLLTGERYVHLQGNDTTLLDPKYTVGAIDALPPRFYKTPFVLRSPDGQVRVFGRLD